MAILKGLILHQPAFLTILSGTVSPHQMLHPRRTGRLELNIPEDHLPESPLLTNNKHVIPLSQSLTTRILHRTHRTYLISASQHHRCAIFNKVTKLLSKQDAHCNRQEAFLYLQPVQHELYPNRWVIQRLGIPPARPWLHLTNNISINSSLLSMFFPLSNQLGPAVPRVL